LEAALLTVFILKPTGGPLSTAGCQRTADVAHDLGNTLLFLKNVGGELFHACHRCRHLLVNLFRLRFRRNMTWDEPFGYHGRVRVPRHDGERVT
jgi:hypothetical protein